MNIDIRIDNNEDGYIDGPALELALRLSGAVGPDHAPVGADGYGLSISIDDEGARELLRLISKEG